MAQDNIFREVDEELRSERMRNLWRRAAPFVIGAAVAIVALVAVNEGWTWFHSSNAARSSDELYEAFDLVDGGDLPAAQAQLDEVIASGSGSYPVLAEFRKAGLLAQQGQTQEAVGAYDALAAGQSNTHLRDLAYLLAANLLVDTGTVADVESRVGSIASSESPLRNAAREALGLAQYRSGDYLASRTNFEDVINDPLTPSATRNRMSFYLGQMLAEGVIVFEDPVDAAVNAVEEALGGDTGTSPEVAPDDPVTTTTEPAAEPAPATP
jgi:hypothetical protein